MKRESVITVVNQGILYGSDRNRKGINVNKGDKNTMQPIVAVVEGSWLDSWPGTMHEEVEDQLDTVEVYGMCEDEGVKEFNL